VSATAEQTIRATVLVETDREFGSGFIVDPDGLVLTACHVLDGPMGIARKVKIRLADGSEHAASLARAHRNLDFALLWLDGPGQYPALAIAPSGETRYAETVLAVGHPGVSDASGKVRALANTVSTGVVANPACRARGIDWIQMTTDIDPGNSGGPLVNLQGQIIGINCWKYLEVSAAKMALPIDYVTEDVSAALRVTREGYASGRVCSICGWFDANPAEWFCPTCGAADTTPSGTV
jgi:serine protease Do